MNKLSLPLVRVLAVSLFLPGTAWAELPDWLPQGITLPEPHEVLMDQQIGASTRLLQVSVENDPSSLFPNWQTALAAAGYDLNTEMMFDGRLLFSNAEVESGQIAVQPLEDDLFMIQIDMTMAAD